MCVLGAVLLKKQDKEKKDGRYHIRKMELLLRVVTPLKQVKTRFYPLKKTAAQLEKDYLTNIKQIHWMLKGTMVRWQMHQALCLIVVTVGFE